MKNGKGQSNQEVIGWQESAQLSSIVRQVPDNTRVIPYKTKTGKVLYLLDYSEVR